jgi:hypothetical protein
MRIISTKRITDRTEKLRELGYTKCSTCYIPVPTVKEGQPHWCQPCRDEWLSPALFCKTCKEPVCIGGKYRHCLCERSAS